MTTRAHATKQELALILRLHEEIQRRSLAEQDLARIARHATDLVRTSSEHLDRARISEMREFELRTELGLVRFYYDTAPQLVRWIVRRFAPGMVRP